MAKEKIYSRHVVKSDGKQSGDEWKAFLKGMMSPEGKPEALDDIVVLDLSYANFCGVIASGFLAEAGAEVITVEPPGGDPCRAFAPHGLQKEGAGAPYLMEARNKRRLCLDLEQHKDRENLRKLAARADLLIDTYAAGELDALGLGFRQLKEINPAMVYLAITPFGHFRPIDSPLARTPWSDLTSQAFSGLNALVGGLPDEPEPYNRPTRAGFYAAGYATAVEAATGALVALFHSRVTGKGQMIDVAAADAYSSCVGVPPTIGHVWKKARIRYGTLDYGLCPYGFFKCKDGFVAIACFRDQDFRAALKILGLWKLEEEWKTLLDRITDDLSRAKKLNDSVEQAVAEFTYEEIYKKFSEYSIKAARSKWRGGGLPVTTRMLRPAEVPEVRHWQERRTFVTDEQTGALLPTAGRLSETPLRIKWVSTGVGADNAELADKYGLDL